MGLTLILSVFLISILCEFIDSSLGMMYGTILSPVLIILGFPIENVVPAILISQALGGLMASFRHNQFGNINIKDKNNSELKIATTIFLFGILAVIFGVFISLNIPKDIIRVYIGALVLIMSLIVLINKRFNFSWKKIYLVGILSSFNKAISGGGFGPLVSTGLIVSGKESKSSVGITGLAEVPIYLSAFVAWMVMNNSNMNLTLITVLCIGSIIGAFFGPKLTSKVDSKKLKIIVGILGVLLGIFCIFGAKI